MSSPQPKAGAASARPPDPAAARALAASLKAAGRRLAGIPAREIAAVLGAVGERFLRGEGERGEGGPGDGIGREAVAETAANAGWSPEMAREALRGMSRSWTRRALERLVAAEFPDPRVLDGFAPGGERALMAAGPALTLHIGAGTVPGATVTAMMRALLVKSAVLAKPGAGDVALTERFARELRRADPRLGAAAAVRYWPGGAAEWDAWERVLLACADQAVVCGGDSAIESVRARAPASTRLVEHPHKLGAAVVALPAPAGAAEAAARAAALFEQRGCVSAHLVFAIGGRREAARWCGELAESLAALDSALPPGPAANPGAMSRAHQLRGRMAMKKAAQADGEAQADAGAQPEAETGGFGTWFRPGSAWTVVMTPRSALRDCFEPAGGRTVWVVPAPDRAACIEAMEPFSRFLQTVGLAVAPVEREQLARDLAALGATRIVPLPSVPFPESDWVHDGARPLGELVRWRELR